MKFKQIEKICQAVEDNIIYLIFSDWDDYGYCTTFFSYYKSIDFKEPIDLGTVKIGCHSLFEKVVSTRSINGYSSYQIRELINTNTFGKLDSDFFSLGQDISYYKKINEIFSDNSDNYYRALNDLSLNFDLFKKLYATSEPCLLNSLMRNLHFSNVEQFNRIINGEVELTEYSFSFKYDDQQINIDVTPNSLPPSNIHVLIGRNGVGKTWLLHNIVHKFLQNSDVVVQSSKKYAISDRFIVACPPNSFTGIIGLTFSVFDDALYLDVVKDDNEINGVSQKRKIDDFNKKYKYIGLISKNQKDGKKKTKSVDDLISEFLDALNRIKKSKSKIELYLETCENLNSDPMFYNNGFINMLSEYLDDNATQKDTLENLTDTEIKQNQQSDIGKYFEKLSSGHMIIILSLTLLAESIYEKTIVLIDEPETHLHPPLLSTYIRTLSFLLIKKNAVAIIATHSPIVLQEVPKDCVSRVERNGENMKFHDIKIESFATSIDSITREVFGLEVVKTGFYKLIEKELESTFDKSFKKFDKKIGFLGQVLMQSLVKKKGDVNEKN